VAIKDTSNSNSKSVVQQSPSTEALLVSLLQTTVPAVYERKQPHVVMWSECDDDASLALSFVDAEGCAAFWY
jgi:hypothetical protein